MKKPKTEIKAISNRRARHVTFSKRRKGLFKKAFELSTLCDVEVAAIVFSNSGNLYDYSSSNTSEVINKRRQSIENEKVAGGLQRTNICMVCKDFKECTTELRHMRGEDIQDLPLEKLSILEDSISSALKRVLKRKHGIVREENDQLKKALGLSCLAD